jgi:shikimate kinase
MYRTGVSFYLAADAALLIGRLLRDTNAAQRPALTPMDLHDEVAAVMAEREPLYMAGMDHMLQAHRSVDELVDDILVALGLKEWDFSEKERVLDRY